MYEDDDFLKARMTEIQNMPPGPERAAAIEEITRDYPGLAEQLGLDVKQAETTLAKESGAGGIAGPSSNPYAIYVGDPVGNVMGGLESMQANKMRGEARKGLETLSEDKSAMRGNAIQAGLPQAQASAIRDFDTGVDPLSRPRTQEEEEEYLRMMGRL